jgi:putative oxidoreductase
MKFLIPVGRFLFSLIFLMTIMSHFKKEAVDYAASQGVPLASFLVPFSAVIAFAGGLSITLGFKAKAGAILIILFLLPVTFYMHAFWKETDPMKMQMQVGNFLKNTALIGASILICWFGAGPISLDEKNQE